MRAVGDNSWISLVTKTTLNFKGPYRKVGTAKLTNHSARTNLLRDIVRSQLLVINRVRLLGSGPTPPSNFFGSDPPPGICALEISRTRDNSK